MVETEGPEFSIDHVEHRDQKFFVQEGALQFRESDQELLFAANKKELKEGSKVRLSEKGREALLERLPKLIKKYPNLRGEVLILSKSGIVLYLPEDVETVYPLEVLPEWLIVE